MYRIGARFILLFGSLVASTTGHTQPRAATHQSASSVADSVAIVAAADRFHEALSSGDTLMIQRLLAPDLVVLEGGAVETRGQYLAHHLSADVAFTRAVPSRRTVRSYTRSGNSAWLASTSVIQGRYKGRDLSMIGAELMILG